jgi:hypothetical protein
MSSINLFTTEIALECSQYLLEDTNVFVAGSGDLPRSGRSVLSMEANELQNFFTFVKKVSDGNGLTVMNGKRRGNF